MGRVSLRNVRKSFGSVDVIKGVDLDVDDGEFLVFVGPSGCGKSTMLRMIAGLESIDGGDLMIDGQRANDVRPSDRGAAMVFQNYALYPHMTVAENMGFALKMAGVGRQERDAQVRRAADVLRIGDLLGRTPRELSGGQRQRVAIGRAIVRKPRVFLFDEPLSNLDAALRVNMRIELSRLHRELGTTMIYVTHDQVEAMTMGTRIAVFNQGRIEQLGAPLALYNAPANEFVAAFLGAPRINLVDAPGHDSTPVQRALWSLLLPRADAAVRRAGVRAEHLRVGALGAGVPATVVMAEHLGDVSVLHLRVDDIGELLHAKVDAGNAHLAAGASVGLLPVADSVLAFDAAGGRIG
jgi:multiple sugar transport system ATP-binding protein